MENRKNRRKKRWTAKWKNGLMKEYKKEVLEERKRRMSNCKDEKSHAKNREE